LKLLARETTQKRRRKSLEERTINPNIERILSSESSSSFPTNLKKSEVGTFETHIMTDEQINT